MGCCGGGYNSNGNNDNNHSHGGGSLNMCHIILIVGIVALIAKAVL